MPSSHTVRLYAFAPTCCRGYLPPLASTTSSSCIRWISSESKLGLTSALLRSLPVNRKLYQGLVVWMQIGSLWLGLSSFCLQIALMVWWINCSFTNEAEENLLCSTKFNKCLLWPVGGQVTLLRRATPRPRRKLCWPVSETSQLTSRTRTRTTVGCPHNKLMRCCLEWSPWPQKFTKALWSTGIGLLEKDQVRHMFVFFPLVFIPLFLHVSQLLFFRKQRGGRGGGRQLHDGGKKEISIPSG